MIHRRLATTAALAGALLLASGPLATAQSADPTDGGRSVSGSSGLRYPQPVAIGSIGGPELTQVPHVDPARYAGDWFQVAAVPQPFTLQCARDTTAHYEVTAPTTLSVRNAWTTAGGAPSGIEGSAEVVDAATNASLRVTFPGVPFQSPDAPPNYRISYLADDYSLAVVGDPARTSGFVLSRTPSLTAEQWATVRSTVQDRGWWDCAFLTTPQVGGRADTSPLCTI